MTLTGTDKTKCHTSNMIKEGNKRIAVTLQEEKIQELEWLVEYYGDCTKSETIDTLIHTSYVMLSQTPKGRKVKKIVSRGE